MGQIWASYIKLDDVLFNYLTSVKYDRVKILKTPALLEPQQMRTIEGNSISLTLVHFHILVAITKKQRHLLSDLDNEFFSSLSEYKDKLTIRFDFKFNGNKILIPMLVEYHCQNNKTNILLKKRLIKIFTEADLPIKEVKKKKDHPTTQFVFE